MVKREERGESFLFLSGLVHWQRQNRNPAGRMEGDTKAPRREAIDSMQKLIRCADSRPVGTHSPASQASQIASKGMEGVGGAYLRSFCYPSSPPFFSPPPSCSFLYLLPPRPPFARCCLHHLRRAVVGKQLAVTGSLEGGSGGKMQHWEPSVVTHEVGVGKTLCQISSTEYALLFQHMRRPRCILSRLKLFYHWTTYGSSSARFVLHQTWIFSCFSCSPHPLSLPCPQKEV